MGNTMMTMFFTFKPTSPKRVTNATMKTIGMPMITKAFSLVDSTILMSTGLPKMLLLA